MINLIFAPITWLKSVIMALLPVVIPFGLAFAGYAVGNWPGLAIAGAFCFIMFGGSSRGNRSKSENNQTGA